MFEFKPFQAIILLIIVYIIENSYIFKLYECFRRVIKFNILEKALQSHYNALHNSIIAFTYFCRLGNFEMYERNLKSETSTY